MPSRALSTENANRPLVLLAGGILGISFVLIATLWLSVEALIDRAIADKIAAATRENTNLARAFEEHTARTLAELDRILLELKDQFEEEGGRLDLPGLWAEIRPDLAISSNASVTDETGTVILTSGPFQPVSLADREHINVHFKEDSGRLFIGKPVEARIVKQWSIPLTRRANNPDGSLKGVVALIVNPLYFSDFYKEIDIGQYGFVSLNGLDGVVRSRLARGPLRLGLNVSSGAVFKQVLKQADGVVISPSVSDGVERLVAYRTVRGHPLYVSVGQSTAEVLAGVRQRGLQDRVFAALATVLILLTAAGLLHAVRRLRTSRLAIAKARDAAEEASTFLRSLADNLPVSIAYIDTERRIRFVNRTTEIWHAQPSANLLGKTSEETGWRYPKVPSRGMARKGHLTREEYSVLYPDGVMRWVDVIRSPHFDEHGSVLGHFRLVVDITERKQIDEKLRENRDLLDNIIDSTPSSVFALDLQHRFTLVNSGMARCHGKSKEALLGKTLHDVFPMPAADGFQAVNEKIIATGEATSAEESVEFGGVSHTFQTSKFALRDTQGKIVGVAGVATDISEAKQAEEKLRQAQRIEAIGQMTGGVAHDFNNLLAVVLGNLELMDAAGLNEKSRRYFQPAIRAVSRGSDLVRQLLAFSRRQTLHPVPTQLAELFPSLRDMMSRTLGETIAWEWDVAPDLLPCLIDPAQLESAILNLSINARDAMPDGGIIVVRAYNAIVDEAFAARHPDIPVGRYVAVAVTDSGHGMTAEVQARAFEPFFTTKDTSRGSGLGLSMVHGFVKQSGGSVTIDSTPQQGTTVTLYLPQSDTPPSVGEGREQKQEKALFSGTVLLVEDQDDVRELAVEQFTFLGFSVLSAARGAEAMTILSTYKGKIDLLFSDVVLGADMNGPELAEEAKRIRPGIKVLFASGYAEPSRRGGRSLDPDAYLLNKPYRRGALIEALRNVLAAEPAAAK